MILQFNLVFMNFNFKILTYSLLIILFTFLFLISCSDSNDSDSQKLISESNKKLTLEDKKIFGIESGIIKYAISGSQEGTRKLYFDDWGRNQAEYSNTTINIGEYSKKTNLLKITKGDDQYIIDLDKRTGTKRENPLIEKLFDLQGQVSHGDFGEQLVLINGGYKTGKEKIDGRNCTIYEFKNRHSKNWMWNWIMLKSEIHYGNMNITILADNIKENASVPDSVFKFPPNVLITEVDTKSFQNPSKEPEY